MGLVNDKGEMLGRGGGASSGLSFIDEMSSSVGQTG